MIDPIEKKIVGRLIDKMLELGFIPALVDYRDGDHQIVCGKDAATEEVFAVDECNLLFTNGKGGKIAFFLVIGEGEDIITDHTANETAEAAMSYAMEGTENG